MSDAVLKKRFKSCVAIIFPAREPKMTVEEARRAFAARGSYEAQVAGRVRPRLKAYAS